MLHFAAHNPAAIAASSRAVHLRLYARIAILRRFPTIPILLATILVSAPLSAVHASTVTPAAATPTHPIAWLTSALVR